jgi:hypothetical protein
MIFQQRIIHFLGQSIGFLLKVFKWHHKKPKLSPISSEESSKMSQKTLLQDSNYNWDTNKMLAAYQEAADCDEYLFGDYDYCSEWMNDTEGL